VINQGCIQEIRLWEALGQSSYLGKKVLFIFGQHLKLVYNNIFLSVAQIRCIFALPSESGTWKLPKYASDFAQIL